MNNSQFRSGLATIALIAVAACSSNAGGYTPAPTAAGPQAVHVANPNARQSTQAPSQPQISLAGAALSVAGSTVNLNEFGSSDSRTVQMLRHGRTIAHKRTPHLVAPTCTRGVEYEYSSNGAGQVSELLEIFYDAQCTLPFSIFELNANYTSAGGTGDTNETLYDRSGNVTSYQNYSLTFATGGDGGLTNLTVQRTNNRGTNNYASSFTCLFQTANAVDCGSGVVSTANSNSWNSWKARIHPNFVLPTPTPAPTATPASGEVGFTQTAIGQYVSSSSSRHSDDRGDGGSGLQLQINGAGFTGANGTLEISGDTPPAWDILGGTQVDTLTGNATIGFGGYQWGRGGWNESSVRKADGFCGGEMTSIALTLVDSANGLTVSLNSNNRGQLTGTVTQTSTGQAVATMTLDFGGSGTISYVGGTTEQVQDWVVVD